MRKLASNSKSPARTSATALAGLALAVTAPVAQLASPLSLWLAGAAMAQAPHAIALKRYADARWKFALDIPVGWNAFPPGPAVKPDEFVGLHEVVRFFPSRTGDASLAAVYRLSHKPSDSLAASVRPTQVVLAKAGFSNFVTGETTIGNRKVATLDFEKLHPGGETWRGRAYFIIDGSLMYVLGFGATERDAAPGLYDRIARSFAFDAAI